MPNPKPLSKEMLLDAMNKTRSNRAAARYLGVSYQHYKKYAKLYKNSDDKTLFEVHLNPHGVGIPKFLSKDGEVGNILDVIEGRIPIEHFTPQKIRDKLIVEGYLKQECYRCKTNEVRITDGKAPLLLHFKDGNKKNFGLNNIELVCYNCTFLYIGDIFNDKQLMHLEDYIPTPKTQEVNWEEIDKNFEKHYHQLGFPKEDDKMDGHEFISRLK